MQLQHTANTELSVFPAETKRFDIRQSTQVNNRYDVYLSKPIDAVHEYVDLFSLLQSANENDVIYMHINCPGGSVDTGLQIISNMRDSRAEIVTAIYGTTGSMATAIFLSGDQFLIGAHSRLMIHNFSGGLYGKGHELKSELKSTTEWIDAAFKEIHVPFITEEEYKSVVDGTDIWLLSDEIEPRLKRLIEHREQEQLESMKFIQIDNLRLQVENLVVADQHPELVDSLMDLIDKLEDAVVAPVPVEKPKPAKRNKKDVAVEPEVDSSNLV